MAIRCVTSLSLVSLVVALANPAAAQQDDAALRSASRKLAQDGVALLQQNHPQEASEKLEKAYELLPVPSVALWSARALIARGRLVQGAERYVEAGRLSGFKGDQQVQVQAQKDAARELEALTPRIPTLIIAVPLDATERPVVTLDAKAVPTALLGEEQPVNPGAHEIKVSFGSHTLTRSVSLAESEKKRETFTPSEAAPQASAAAAPSSVAPTDEGAASPGRTRRTLSFVALAAGGAGLVVGGVTGALALSKHGALADSSNCASDICLPSERSDVDSLNTLRTVSSIGFIAGGVLAATGIVLMLTDKPTQSSARLTSPRVTLRISASALDVSGVF